MVPDLAELERAVRPGREAVRIIDLGLDTRTAVAGGSNVDPPLARAMAQAFPGARVQNLYGLSETSGACVMSAADDDLGTVCETLGTPLDGVDVRVVDPVTGAAVPDGQDGELQVRGECLAAGYWDMPTETADAFRDGCDVQELPSAEPVAQLARVFYDDPPAAFLAWQEQTRAVSRKFDVRPEDKRDILTNLWQWRPAGAQ